MNNQSRSLLGSAIFLAVVCIGCTGEKPQKTSTHEKRQEASVDVEALKEVFTLYDGFEKDRVTLHETVRRKVPTSKKGTIDASTFEACEAAGRVFGRVSFLFKKRDDVLKLLGDPTTNSEYNKKAMTGPNAPLVYVFDTGETGNRFTLKFRSGYCLGVEVEPIQ